MVAIQTDIFSAPPLAGLAQGEDIVTADQERALIEEIDRAELSPFRFHRWVGKRMTASFGWHYDFDKATFQPTDPIPNGFCRCGSAPRARRFTARRVRPGHADPV